MYMATSLTLHSPLRETEIGARIWQTQKERNWAILSGGTSCPEPIENYLWNLAKKQVLLLLELIVIGLYNQAGYRECHRLVIEAVDTCSF